MSLFEERVDMETGEILSCPACEEKLKRIQELEQLVEGEITNRQGWILKYNNLKADKEEEAKGSKEWQVALEVFNYWRERTGHRRSRFTFDRFEEIKALLKTEPIDLLKRAVDGIAFDPHMDTRKNGSVKRYDDFELCFRDRKHYEEFCNRAPLNGFSTNGRKK